MIYSGASGSKWAVCGGTVCVDAKFQNKIVSYFWVSDRIIIVCFKKRYVNVIGMYSPEDGKDLETDIFWEELQSQTDSCIWAFSLTVLQLATLQLKIQLKHMENIRLTIIATNWEHLITNIIKKKALLMPLYMASRGSRSLIDYVIVNQKIVSHVQDRYSVQGLWCWPWSLCSYVVCSCIVFCDEMEVVTEENS